VRLLDRSSDPAHNRSVLTLAGDAAPLKEAVLALFEGAVGAIDLRSHTGEHPRLGAVDVVPFIPIEGVTMAECVALARETAAAVAERFGVPVYLYEEAATTPARKNLEDIRRVLESEVVGLVPSAALVGTAEHFLQLSDFRLDQVLETKAAPDVGARRAVPGAVPSRAPARVR
jgi:glutamate formiminotransferase